MIAEYIVYDIHWHWKLIAIFWLTGKLLSFMLKNPEIFSEDNQKIQQSSKRR